AAGALMESRGGRAPSLTRRGLLWAWGGALLILIGGVTASWRVVGLGVAQLAVLGAAYLWFFPSAILIWGPYLGMELGLERPGGEGGFVVGRPFRLVILLRARGPRPLGRAQLRVFRSSALEIPPLVGVDLGAEEEVTSVVEVSARQVGYWHLHGAAIEVAS